MPIYEFLNFRLDSQERTLTRDGAPVQLAPKVFDTLLALVSKAGKVVAKETLIAEIWADTFVEENNLTQYVFILRRELGEKKDGQKIIETVPRRGYRFAVPVREIAEAENFSRAAELENSENKSSLAPGEAARADETKAHAQERKISPAARKIGNRFLLISVAVLLIVFLSVSFLRRSSLKEKTWSPENIRLTRLTDNGKLQGSDLSPDGKSLAYVLREGKGASLRLKNIATESEIVLAAANENFGIELTGFSPDGNYIYFQRQKPKQKFEVFQIPVFGGEARKTADNSWSGVSVSPDGSLLAFVRFLPSQNKFQIIAAATDGSFAERVVAERNAPDYFHLWSSAPVWSPDGKTLTMTGNTTGDRTTRLIEVNVESGAERELKIDKSFYWINWIERLSDDALVLIAQESKESNGQLWRVRLSDGETTRITNDSSNYLVVKTVPNSNRIVAQQQFANQHLWLFDGETNQSRQLTGDENKQDGRDGLCFAPDGKIIYTSIEKGVPDIYELDPATGENRRLTKRAGWNLLPAVSPDGQFIAFVSDRAGANRIWMMRRDGGDARQVTSPETDKKFSETAPAFSPDGRWIYYLSSPHPLGIIFKIPIEGGAAVQVTPEAKGRNLPALSADGKFLAFLESVTDETVRVAVASTADGAERYFDFDVWGNLGFMPNSFALVAAAAGEGNNLFLHDLTTGETKQMTNFTQLRTDRFAVSPDGRQFVVSRGNDVVDAVLIER